jgi:putative peptidoglycan lipid II flippase
LAYGNKVVSLIIGLGALALGSAVFPEFSRMAASEDWRNISRTLRFIGLALAATTIPLTATLYLFSQPLVGLIYERGAFGVQDTVLVGRVQSMLVLQIPFYLFGIVLVRLVSALQMNHILLWGTVISVVVNVGLNFLLMTFLGVAGIALSTSIVYVVACGYLMYCVDRALRIRVTERAPTSRA